MLPSNIDLTIDRDFGMDSSADVSDLLDMASIASAQVLSVELQMAAGASSPTVQHIKFYPWNIYEIDQDTVLHEGYFSEDAYSNLMGFEFWDEPEHAFVLGNVNDRRVAKYILSSEDGSHCDSCGKLLNLFDECPKSLNEYSTIITCKNCQVVYAYKRYKEDFLSIDSVSFEDL